MSKTNKIFESIPVQIPDRSGFDLSHEVLTTAKTGTIIPITHFEVLPGDTISMGSMMKVTLPPFAVPFMGRVDAALEAFFVPNRILWQGWQPFITQNNGVSTSGNTGQFVPASQTTPTTPATNFAANVPIAVPRVFPIQHTVGMPSGASNSATWADPGYLANYLGVKRYGNVANSDLGVSALPFLAYHKVCDDWYRDDNNMKPFFPKINPFGFQYGSGVFPDPDSSQSRNEILRSGHLAPFVSSTSGYAAEGGIESYWLQRSLSSLPSGAELPFDTSIGLGELRQRCWSKDYFTSATTRPQAGADSSVVFDTSGNTGSFTIATLRAANALQKWLERNNISGTEYGSQILAHFGVTPPDTVLNRAILLGQVRTPVVVSSVENNTGTGASTGTRSPYGNTLGAAAGFGSGFDKGNLVDNFTAKEHGFIMVMFTLIPHAYYNTGVSRELLHLTCGDFAWPEFAGIGDQPIYCGELVPTGTDAKNVWAYQQRYVEYKHKLDQITGLLSDGNNLAPFALQRGFSSTPSLGSEFLTIPTNYLDQVLGVEADVAGFGCMVDAFFDARALRVLPEYSLPHL